MTLENITGNLKDAYKQVVPGTMQCVDQLMTKRRNNPELRSQWFYTADGNIYSVDNGTPTLRITRETVNPVLNNIDDAFTQLTKKGNYQVLSTDFDVLKAAEDTVTIHLTKLTLQGEDKEWQYLALSTTKYKKLNSEERTLAERVYGQGTDFVENMKMLKDAGINETRVYVLNPQYVKTRAKDNPVGRASWLNLFYNYSSFDACVRSVSSDRLRGVRREVVVAAGDAPKNEAVPPVPVAPQEATTPCLDDVLAFSKSFIPDRIFPDYETGLRNLYKQ